MDDIRQCPYCPLRFINEVELRSHISLDHPEREPEDEDA